MRLIPGTRFAEKDRHFDRKGVCGMTLPDPSLDRPTPDTGHVQDRLPTTERGEDPARDAVTHELVNDPARPLTDAERQAAEHDIPRPERVYAPASERVPKEPLPGHREVIEHEDPSTPERQHAVDEPSSAWSGPSAPSTTGAAPSSAPSMAGPSPSSTTGMAGPSTSSAAYGAPASAPSAYTPPSPSAYAPSSGAAFTPESDDEPSFTRVARPSQTATVTTPTPSPYASTATNPGFETSPEMGADWTSAARPWAWTFGWVALAAGSAFGVWLYLRWQRERNKPINRLRRQARQAATGLRDRVPSSDDVVSPSLGVLAALASTALVLFRRLQGQRPARTAKHTVAAISDADWQKRLIQLKERWTPHRLELEKVSISRH
jgi:hypothetical protein